jgi:hypothetical protein
MTASFQINFNLLFTSHPTILQGLADSVVKQVPSLQKKKKKKKKPQGTTACSENELS